MRTEELKELVCEYCHVFNKFIKELSSQEKNDCVIALVEMCSEKSIDVFDVDLKEVVDFITEGMGD